MNALRIRNAFIVGVMSVPWRASVYFSARVLPNRFLRIFERCTLTLLTLACSTVQI